MGIIYRKSPQGLVVDAGLIVQQAQVDLAADTPVTVAGSPVTLLTTPFNVTGIPHTEHNSQLLWWFDCSSIGAAGVSSLSFNVRLDAVSQLQRGAQAVAPATLQLAGNVTMFGSALLTPGNHTVDVLATAVGFDQDVNPVTNATLEGARLLCLEVSTPL